MSERANDLQMLARDVRIYVFQHAAASARVPQAPEIAKALERSEHDVRLALAELAANPFCAVPSGFRVATADRRYWGICIWDALGIAAALRSDATISAPCGDCGAGMSLEVRGGRLVPSEGMVHFAIPAHHWWDNIGFT